LKHRGFEAMTRRMQYQRKQQDTEYLGTLNKSEQLERKKGQRPSERQRV
jgi:hypothetical protein